jgi:hypothetical protein
MNESGSNVKAGRPDGFRTSSSTPVGQDHCTMEGADCALHNGRWMLSLKANTFS